MRILFPWEMVIENVEFEGSKTDKDNMIIKATSDKSKAIVIHNSYAFGRHFEFNVEDNERRTILWYEDKGIYCGYIYDKTYKVCKYFESRKEFRRFMRRPFFNRNLNN